MKPEKQKILIITYFYPPCNLTAANRVKSWATYFHKFGLYPVIITRNWDLEVTSNTDILKPSGEKIVHEINEDYEVFYLPHKGSLRDKLYARWGGTKFSFITKPLTLLELWGQNFFSFFTPFMYLYRFAKKYIQEHPDFSKVLISGNPFILFKFGYKLKKVFPRLHWFADYRDDWSTSELHTENSFIKGVIGKMEAHSEKKWVSTAAFITSVSPWYTQKIADFTGRKGYTIYNGYQEMVKKEVCPPGDVFILLYNGTLYPTQPVEDFFEVMKEVVGSFPSVKFRIKFPGLGFDPVQAERVRKISSGIGIEVDILPRIPRDEVLKMQGEAHVLLMFTHTGKKGIPSSKIFEYMSMDRPVLVYPNDHDILEKLITETHTGKVCSTREELRLTLSGFVNQFVQKEPVHTAANRQAIKEYTRENLARHLAGLIMAEK